MAIEPLVFYNFLIIDKTNSITRRINHPVTQDRTPTLGHSVRLRQLADARRHILSGTRRSGQGNDSRPPAAGSAWFTHSLKKIFIS
jgi:hypothetical protein